MEKQPSSSHSSIFHRSNAANAVQPSTDTLHVDHATTSGLDWSNVSFSITEGRGKKAKEKLILDNVSGSVRRGEITAIIGPSGSGKTSLMNILTGRVEGKSKIEGRILFEGRKRDEDAWKSTVGYVEQFDLLYDSLTCWETLAFSAMTRLPRSYTTAQKLEKAQSVLRTLALEKVRDSKVGGDQKRGVSGGERKRVAVGCELVTSPKLLCLDECTSGLDSYSAYSVISTAHGISRLNVAVLCTIHQPSYEIFSKFDRVILMALGRIAFHGTVPAAIEHFANLGYPLPQGANAADHFISLLTEPGDKSGVSQEEQTRVQRLLDAWSDITDNKAMKDAEAGEDNEITRVTTEDKERAAHFGLNYMTELYWLMKRAWTQQIRSPTNFIAGLIQSIFMTIILGFTFFRLGFNQADVIGRGGLLFFIPINNTFSVLFPIITFLPFYNGILRKERSTGAYRVSTYLISRYSVEIPVAFISRLPFFVLTYWMCNFSPSAAKFFIFVGINLLTVLCAICMGMFIGSLSAKLQVVQAVTPALNICFILFAGFLLPLPSIPNWFIWIHWISYATYVFCSLTLNEFRGLVFECDQGNNGGQCFRTGEDFIKRYDLDTFSVGQNVGFLCAIIIIFAVLGYFRLRMLTKPKLRLD